MVFLFILDVITSVTLSLAVKCSSWVIYKSANGLYYIYKKIIPDIRIENQEMINDKEYIILTSEEYDKLSAQKTDVNAIEPEKNAIMQ